MIMTKNSQSQVYSRLAMRMTDINRWLMLINVSEIIFFKIETVQCEDNNAACTTKVIHIIKITHSVSIRSSLTRNGKIHTDVH